MTKWVVALACVKTTAEIGSWKGRIRVTRNHTHPSPKLKPKPTTIHINHQTQKPHRPPNVIPSPRRGGHLSVEGKEKGISSERREEGDRAPISSVERRFVLVGVEIGMISVDLVFERWWWRRLGFGLWRR
ncbi:hypothetical protein LWI28_010755 [Acer negundo]|uniref:Uncharacterized protein n=1 Tax=Acer negundo TaxID=4023 RepID=A0AAD5I648_ACENE|nr:hypothetical protein LWI28_010755 [Acer negundo]